MQAAPPVPHDVLDSEPSASHVPPAVQQPLHEDPPQVHAPEEHDCPEAHAEQAAPPAPHVPDDCDPKGTQVLPLQQPFGHEVASQTHCPVVVLHSWPDGHAAQAAPAVPHEVADWDP